MAVGEFYFKLLGSTPGLEVACCRLLVHIQRTDQARIDNDAKQADAPVA